ncbi:MAG: nucleoside triphosphate pyrophosphohydrolase [Alphaproteobacteria bacterium]|nr:nucleoside triphosphate pyrophosphohydrolase [Alphaproteobacteria bacterium]
MMKVRRFKMETLVRDKFPGRIEKLGGRVHLRKIGSSNYIHSLKLKLKEEVEEVYKASTLEEVKEELGDVLEVLYTLAKTQGLELAHIEQIRLQKRNERGGFRKGNFAEFVEVESDDDKHPIVQYCKQNKEKYPEIL